jgi:hypothetical protein
MTWTDDLARIRYRHVPELAFAEGLESPIEALAVGWLGDRVPSTGRVDDDLLAALQHFSRHHYVGRGELGLHTCGICGRVAGGGEFLIETPGRRYLLPQLVLHYIADHDYRPPEVFLSDLARYWGSPEASQCRTDSCGSTPRLPSVEPCPEAAGRDAAGEELVLLAAKLRDQGLGKDEIKEHLLQWRRERFGEIQETEGLDAGGPAADPAPGKRRYLAVYDYGMGGIWLLMDARSKRDIEEVYPELEVYETRPDWMSPAEEQQYRADCLAGDMCWDIDATPSGWLKTLVDNRDQDVNPSGRALSLIFKILCLTFPIALLAVWLAYWLLS